MIKFDGRKFTNKKINWKEIKPGHVILEGIGPNFEYRILTDVYDNYWEYFENGYYHSTSPEYCHWLVVGQKNADGELIKINYDE